MDWGSTFYNVIVARLLLYLEKFMVMIFFEFEFEIRCQGFEMNLVVHHGVKVSLQFLLPITVFLSV